MNEEHLARLRNRLQIRRDRLCASKADHLTRNLVRFWEFLANEPFLATILENLRSNGEGAVVAKSALNLASRPDTFANAKAILEKLTTDEDYAAFVYHALDGVCRDKWRIFDISRVLRNQDPGDHKDWLEFKQEMIIPLCDYVDEKLDDQQAILGLLVRYKRRCEWFNRSEVLKIAQDKAEGRRAAVEECLKADLYRFLYDQGIDFTIEPASDRGRIDLILDQRGGDRKYLEGKVFDNDNRNTKYIIKGFGQLLHYLRQYNATRGYLLIYKTCEEHLVVQGAEQLGEVSFVCCEGKKILILVVDVCQYERPVSQRTSRSISITADELIKANPIG